MKTERKMSRALRSTLLAFIWTLSVAAAHGSMSLEGQNKGDTNTWSAGNLQNWQELDYIPCRVHVVNAQGSNQSITINFEHVNGAVPGIQNLFTFTSSSNVIFSAPPVLFAPPTQDTWSYTFSITVLD